MVEDLELPSDDPEYLKDLVWLDMSLTDHHDPPDQMRTRGWGPSVLLVDTADVFPTNITVATEDIPHVNLM